MCSWPVFKIEEERKVTGQNTLLPLSSVPEDSRKSIIFIIIATLDLFLELPLSHQNLLKG